MDGPFLLILSFEKLVCIKYTNKLIVSMRFDGGFESFVFIKYIFIEMI